MDFSIIILFCGQTYLDDDETTTTAAMMMMMMMMMMMIKNCNCWNNYTSRNSSEDYYSCE